MNQRQALHHAMFCESCAYFQEQEHGNGNCHRFPPSFAGDTSPKESSHWKFPVVHSHSWCGEHNVCSPSQTRLGERHLSAGDEVGAAKKEH